MTRADLSLSQDEDGAFFPGFSEGGSWIVAIEHRRCLSPAPMVFARVELP